MGRYGSADQDDRPVSARVAIGVWILLSVVGWIAIVGAFVLIVT